jgi:hypothetical protein
MIKDPAEQMLSYSVPSSFMPRSIGIEGILPISAADVTLVGIYRFDYT